MWDWENQFWVHKRWTTAVISLFEGNISSWWGGEFRDLTLSCVFLSNLFCLLVVLTTFSQTTVLLQCLCYGDSWPSACFTRSQNLSGPEANLLFLPREESAFLRRWSSWPGLKRWNWSLWQIPALWMFALEPCGPQLADVGWEIFTLQKCFCLALCRFRGSSERHEHHVVFYSNTALLRFDLCGGSYVGPLGTDRRPRSVFGPCWCFSHFMSLVCLISIILEVKMN